jgi:uncharacterized protein
MTLALAGIVALGAAAGGFVQGLSGFAFGLVALGIWVWAVDPKVAGALVVFGTFLGQLMALGAARPGFDAARLSPFIIGGLLGVPIGVAALRHIDPAVFKLAVGMILLIWGPLMLATRALPPIAFGGRWADGTAGWIGGVMAGLAGLNGPAPIAWCTLRGWSRDAQRAVFQTYSLVIQGVTMAAYFATGTIGAETLRLFAIVAPAMLVPTLIGARLYRRFSDAGFRRLILWLLTASGVVLVASSLARLL